jgi:hypothetical protein
MKSAFPSTATRCRSSRSPSSRLGATDSPAASGDARSEPGQRHRLDGRVREQVERGGAKTSITLSAALADVRAAPRRSRTARRSTGSGSPPPAPCLLNSSTVLASSPSRRPSRRGVPERNHSCCLLRPGLNETIPRHPKRFTPCSHYRTSGGGLSRAAALSELPSATPGDRTRLRTTSQAPPLSQACRVQTVFQVFWPSSLSRWWLCRW